jgi:hypothetical protein
VVNDSCPPACFPDTTNGFKLARAAYTAAVFPAQPDPMISTFLMLKIRLYNVARRCDASPFSLTTFAQDRKLKAFATWQQHNP